MAAYPLVLAKPKVTVTPSTSPQLEQGSDSPAQTPAVGLEPASSAPSNQSSAAEAEADLPEGNAVTNSSSYRTVESIYADLSKLAADNPDLAAWVDIGDSYDKATPDGAPGYDIFALQLSSPKPAQNSSLAADEPLLLENSPGKPILFLQAAIHGQDSATAELATRFAESLVARYGIDPEATWLLDYFEIRIVPIVNPDGQKLAEQNAWRKNANPTPPPGGAAAAFPNYGVDLDRNYDVQWGKIVNGASTDPASPFYQGSAAFSEPETKALRDYLLTTFPAGFNGSGVFIDLQSNGNQILYPNGFTEEAALDYQGLRNLGLKLGYFTGSDGVAYDVLQASGKGIASGTASDWAYQTFGVATYTIAAGSQTVPDDATFESTIVPELLPALSYAVKSAQQPYQAPLGPDVRSVSLGSAQAIAGFTNSVALSVTIDSGRFGDSNASSEISEGKTLPTPKIIAGARYSVDLPSWFPNARTFNMSIASGSYDSPVETMVAAIDTSSLQPGRHTIFVEGLDASGNYGVPTAVFLDVVSAPENASSLRGTDANDTFAPTEPRNFVVLGRGGDDRIQTIAGQDLVLAGDGNDTASAGEQNDVVFGGAGDDLLNGNNGNDTLYGEAGADQLAGGEGDDLLWGGLGNDTLTGEAGIDTFALSYSEGIDTILDFDPGADRIGLVGTLKFSQLSISENGPSTLIKFRQTTLAELTNVSANSLTAANFVSL